MHCKIARDKSMGAGLRAAALGLSTLMAAGAAAAADGPSTRDIQVISRALGFVETLPAGSEIAIVHTAGDPASRAEAERAAAAMADGIKAGGRTLKPRLVGPTDDISAAAAVYAAGGVSAAALSALQRRRAAPCVTLTFDYIANSACVMAFRTQPKVDIVVSIGAAQATNTSFSAAFRMLIREQ